MSLHIIKCKTILKINEIETINLTSYLNFHRRTETGGESTCALGLCRDSWFSGASTADISRRPGQAPSAGQVVASYLVSRYRTSSQPQTRGVSSISQEPRPESPVFPENALGRSVGTLTPWASGRFSQFAPVHLRERCLAAAWLCLLRRFNTLLSRLVGLKLE